MLKLDHLGPRHHEAAAIHPRNRHQVRQCRPDQGTDPGRTHDSLPDGRYSRKYPWSGGGAGEWQCRQPWSKAFTRWANAVACRCTAPTGWVPIRCWTLSCSDARPATSSSAKTSRPAPTRPCPRTRARGPANGWRISNASTGGEQAQDVANDIAPHDAGALRRVPQPATLSEGVTKVKEIAEQARRRHRRQEPNVQHRARRSAGTGEPGGDAMATIVSAEARQESRGAQATSASDFPHPRRRQLDEAHALVQRRNRLDYKPVNLTAADRGVLPAQGRGPTDHGLASMKFQIYRYDPEKDAKPISRTMTSSSIRTTGCCSMR